MIYISLLWTSDGLGEYLCGYYDGDEDICPAPGTPKEYGPICMTVCRSCDDDFVKDYVNNLVSGESSLTLADVNKIACSIFSETQQNVI